MEVKTKEIRRYINLEFSEKDFPICPIQIGRFYDGISVVTCGCREVTLYECIACKSKIKKSEEHELHRKELYHKYIQDMINGKHETLDNDENEFRHSYVRKGSFGYKIGVVLHNEELKNK